MKGGGLGPWFCALYVNISNKAKQKTDLRVHTYPLLFERLRPKWVAVIVIGPFVNWKEAETFYGLWKRQTRGISRRMQRGLNLYTSYREKYTLTMWVTNATRQKILNVWKSEEINAAPTRDYTQKNCILMSDIHKIQQCRKRKKIK